MKNRTYGTAGDDTIKGSDGGDEIYGRLGDDLLLGRDGGDTLTGESGQDTLIGGAGNDWLIAGSSGHGDDLFNSLVGGAGDDLLEGGASDIELGGAGDDYLVGFTTGSGLYDGGAGHDTLQLSLGPDAYTGDLGFLAQARDEVQVNGATLRSVEAGRVFLSDGDNVVTLADDVHNWSLWAGSGDDRLTGNGHADSIFGGEGDNTLVGGGGDDVLRTDTRIDRQINPLDASLLDGGSGDDTIFGYGTLNGGDGDDLLIGPGLAGNVLNGGAGADTLEGSTRSQMLYGGEGQDVYVFRYVFDSPAATPDHIVDDDFGIVDLSLVDAVSGTPRNDAFTLVHRFSGHAGELTISYQSAQDVTHVKADVDGDGKADMVILVAGDHTDPGAYVL